MQSRYSSPLTRVLIKNLKDAIVVWDKADDLYGKGHPKERLARGIVRGMATQLLTHMRPSENVRPDRIKRIEAVEQEFGMPGPRQGQYSVPEVSNAQES